MLTTGQDDLVGTAGNDTFKALIVENNLGDGAQTIQGFDSLNGGAGTDTLDATLLDDVTINTTSVEVLSLRTGDNGAYVVGVAADVAKLNNNTLGELTINGAAGLATINTGANDLTVNDMAATTVALKVTGANETTVTLNGDKAAETLNLVFDGALTVDSDATEKLNVTVKGGGSFADDDADALLVNDHEGVLTSVTINGSGDLYLSVGEDGAALETLDASALIGGVYAHLDNSNQVLATVKGGQGDDYLQFHGSLAADAAVTLGAGDDTLYVSDAAGDVTVDAGAGNDFVDVDYVAGSVTINGGDGNNADAYLFGDFKTATVTLNNAYDDAKEPTETSYASVEFDSWGYGFGAKVEPTEYLHAVTSLTLKGDGYADVYNREGDALATVDASALNSKESDGEGALIAADGLYYYTENTSVAETVKLGGGIDSVWFGASETDGFASNVAKMDTLTGLHLVGTAADAKVLDESLSDTIGIWDYTDLENQSSVVGFELFTLSAASAAQSSLNVALLEVAASDKDHVVFEFKGNTYVYGDIPDVLTDTVTNNDLLIKLTGTYDTDLLLQSLNRDLG